MANNRMWLMHRPSGLAMLLGKRMSWGWYRPPEADDMKDFFQYLAENPEGSQDDFILIMEDGTESSCSDDWRYAGKSPEGFMQIHLSDSSDGE